MDLNERYKNYRAIVKNLIIFKGKAWPGSGTHIPKEFKKENQKRLREAWKFMHYNGYQSLSEIDALFNALQDDQEYVDWVIAQQLNPHPNATYIDPVYGPDEAKNAAATLDPPIRKEHLEGYLTIDHIKAIENPSKSKTEGGQKTDSDLLETDDSVSSTPETVSL